MNSTLIPCLSRHLISSFKELVKNKSDDNFNLDDFDFVPNMEQVLMDLSQGNIDFEDFFILFEKKYTLSHPFVQKLISCVRNISPLNLATYCSYALEYQKMGIVSFEDKINSMSLFIFCKFSN